MLGPNPPRISNNHQRKLLGLPAFMIFAAAAGRPSEAEPPVGNRRISVLPVFFCLKPGASRKVTVRGIQYFDEDAQLYPQLWPYNWKSAPRVR